MTGEIGEDISISEEEIQELQVIKKIKKKIREKCLGYLQELFWLWLFA